MIDLKTSDSKHSYTRLFLISFLVLFFELACIRWFGSHVVFLTFFTNIVLLASFLGMSVGCLAARRKMNFINIVPVLVLIAVLSAMGMFFIYVIDADVVVNVGQQDSAAAIYFGTEYRHPDVSKIVIPMEVIAGFFFVLIALIFIGLGQVMGRQFDKIPNRILAYTTNIVGSLVGIGVFALISYLWLSPFWWFLIGMGCTCYFISGRIRRRFINYGVAAVVVFIVGMFGWRMFLDEIYLMFKPDSRSAMESDEPYWSPYYGITYSSDTGGISVNGIGHQWMKEMGATAPTYLFPYFLSRDSGRPPIEDVMIIGAGSGNDVSAALLAGVKHIDAVEIDPVIYDIGRRNHPDKPYSDPRVQIHLNDGRNFLKTTEKKYDLIVYALVDSLVLHSGYSSIRLESFLFTKQAFEDIKSRLKDNGIFVMYNYFRKGWLVGRLKRLACEVFDKEPIVVPMPPQPEVDDSSEIGFTTILVGDTDRIAAAFESGDSYWMPKKDILDRSDFTGFALQAPGDNVAEFRPAKVNESTASSIVPTDFWPFLYLNSRSIPMLSLRGMAMIAVLSLIILVIFIPRKTIRFNWTMFFLGAGFMLLETKGVVHLALLFGSTWIVNSIVFFAILVMILLSNLYVIVFRPKRLSIYYIALVILLVVNIFVGLDVFLGMSEAAKIVGSCLLVFTPVFFAGVIFASYFRKSINPNADIGSNIAGVVLGGLAENFSMILGFDHLLWVAVGFYLLSRLLKFRAAASPAQPMM